MAFSRSERRHHNRRLFVKRYWEERRYGHANRDDDEWIIRNVRLRLHTNTRCSCTLCGTPRRLYGNSHMALTHQEHSANLHLSEYIFE